MQSTLFRNHRHLSVTILHGRPFLPANIRNVFKKRCFGSNLSVTQKLTVYFLRSTGFSLLYANFYNLLEIRCDEPQLLRTADQCLDLVIFVLYTNCT